jgi:hypothetical protein
MKVFTVDEGPLPLLVDEGPLRRRSAYTNVRSTYYYVFYKMIFINKLGFILETSLFLYDVCHESLHYLINGIMPGVTSEAW